jgi:hypothetical protein
VAYKAEDTPLHRFVDLKFPPPRGRRSRKRCAEFGYDGLFDRRKGNPSPKQLPDWRLRASCLAKPNILCDGCADFIVCYDGIVYQKDLELPQIVAGRGMSANRTRLRKRERKTPCTQAQNPKVRFCHERTGR